MKTKYCKRCGGDLPLSQFNKNKHGKDGLTFYCKKCISEYGKAYRSTPVGIYYQIKNRNKYYKTHPFRISIDDFCNWYESQDKTCIYCGLLEEDLPKIKDKYNEKSLRLSVDCIDNDGGYEVGNLVIACHRCNSMKSDLLNFEEMRYFGNYYIRPKWEKQLGKKLNLSTIRDENNE